MTSSHLRARMRDTSARGLAAFQMRTGIFKTLAAAAMLLCAFTAQADSQTIDGVKWTYTIVGGKAEVGNGSNVAIDKDVYDLVIPAQLGGKAVTSIAASAFKGCTTIQTVRMPSTVTEIKSTAFEGCTGLLFVTLSENLTTIWNGAFQGCATLDSIMIPESVTRVHTYAFANCSNLGIVSMVATTSLGKATEMQTVFQGCPNVELRLRKTETVDGLTWSYLTDDTGAIVYRGELIPAIPEATSGAVTVPATLGGKPVKQVGDYAFFECEDIESVTIPEGVTSIGTYAFYECDDLESVTMPSTVTSIVEGAFQECGLKSVTIPEGVTSIEDYTFFKCVRLKSATIPATVTNIGDSAFYGTALTSVTIPEGVTSVGVYAFRDCEALTQAYVPATVTSLGTGVFEDCKNLKSVTIAKGVTAIPDEMFVLCTSLESVIIPDGVKSLGDYAFWGCSKLASLAIPKSVTSIGSAAFAGDTSAWKIVYVEPGDTERVKKLIESSGRDTGKLTFVEAYTVTFDANGGSCETRYRVREPGQKLGDLPEAVKANATFLGWFTAVKGGTQITAETLVKANFTAYAHWKEKGSFTLLRKEDIVEPYTSTKALTLLGAVYDQDGLAGVVELKLGKANLKKMTCKVSGTITMLNGKKYTIKSKKVDLNEKYASSAVLTVKRLGTLYLAFGGVRFAGDVDELHLQVDDVGGAWTKSEASATVELDAKDLDKFDGAVFESFLPKTEKTTSISRGKWNFAKAASVKWAKPKAGATVLLSDAASGKGLVVDVSKGKTNLSGLKLTYTPKKGTFKGSFKVYALQSAGGSKKLKKYTISVNGAVVDGCGYGFATSKRPALAWPVSVE